MVVTALPDLSAAIMLYLKDCTELAALVGTRIFLEWPTGEADKITVPPYKNVILINTGRGGTGDIGLSLQEERVDISCYGANAMVAHNIWKLMDSYFYSPDRSRKTSFTKAHCRVLMCYREAGPLRLNDNGWAFTSAPYIFTYSGVATP